MKMQLLSLKLFHRKLLLVTYDPLTDRNEDGELKKELWDELYEKYQLSSNFIENALVDPFIRHTSVAGMTNLSSDETFIMITLSFGDGNDRLSVDIDAESTFYGYFAHELFHTIHLFARSMKCPINDETHEIFAYIQGELFQECYKTLHDAFIDHAEAVCKLKENEEFWENRKKAKEAIEAKISEQVKAKLKKKQDKPAEEVKHSEIYDDIAP